MLDQQNRQQFLDHLAAQLGRPPRKTVAGHYSSVTAQPTTRLTDLTADQRCEEFVKVAQEVMAVECSVTTPSEAATALLALCEQQHGGDVILNDDPRLNQYGLTQAVQAHYPTHIWSAQSAVENRTFAEKANIGIVFAEYGLVESGGVVLYSAAERGRSSSLLPQVSIVVLNKSSIQPRVAQVAEILHQQAAQGMRMPSCINIISGPSSTADIELVKVIGVHGPIKQIYLIIDDL
ncbi:LutC/YkgG family protein [Testudinibacter aquarius]|uniref:L-lactate dehydrogenase complex protein LldG n=3 Tax=Testudinibacter aquarius TaxID=1524974 RepID=A0A4R3Y1Y7_9PAST|nr:lactate utilization protein C [Testudinibacter aquarius]KAE9526410.1 lactate utilization protein B/C [Testudinibacter aquarius]TCV85706.1 L-lactate dehydrogenase complex protein LldG [Testudinibacter aquarius]